MGDRPVCPRIYSVGPPVIAVKATFVASSPDPPSSSKHEIDPSKPRRVRYFSGALQGEGRRYPSLRERQRQFSWSTAIAVKTAL